MCQLQGAGIERSDDSQRLSGHDVLGVFPSDLGLEAVHDPTLRQTLHTLRHGPLEHDIEGVFVVARGKDFGLALSRIPESPCLVVEYTLSP